MLIPFEFITPCTISITVLLQVLRLARLSCCLPQEAPGTGPSAFPRTTAMTATRSSSSTALRQWGSQTASSLSTPRSPLRSLCGWGMGHLARRRRRFFAAQTKQVGELHCEGHPCSGAWSWHLILTLKAPTGCWWHSRFSAQDLALVSRHLLVLLSGSGPTSQ